jgi:hypothetical protein
MDLSQYDVAQNFDSPLNNLGCFKTGPSHNVLPCLRACTAHKLCKGFSINATTCCYKDTVVAGLGVHPGYTLYSRILGKWSTTP